MCRIILRISYSLKDCQETWRKKLDTLPSTEMLMANCILAAAITVYCGPMQTLTRHKFFESLQRTCRDYGFPTADQGVLKLGDFPRFMLGVVRVCTMELSVHGHQHVPSRVVARAGEDAHLPSLPRPVCNSSRKQFLKTWGWGCGRQALHT
jgi:hypothetical protein